MKYSKALNTMQLELSLTIPMLNVFSLGMRKSSGCGTKEATILAPRPNLIAVMLQ